MPEPALPPPSPPRPVRLLSLYMVFFWVGLFSFGGGLVAWLHREVVQVRGWMTDEDFFSGYALSQVVPGVNSTNMSVYIGQRLWGALGALVALLGLLSGPFVVVLGAAVTYQWLSGISGFQAAMAGIAAAAMGLLLRLAISAAQTALRRWSSWLAMLATFIAVGVLQWPLLPVVAVIAPLSVWAAWPRKAADA